MKRSILVLLLIITGVACNDRDKKNNLLDTPTSGSLLVYADESLKPLLDAEVQAFEGIYRNAEIQVVYGSEQDAVNALMHDSVRLAIITRELLHEESHTIELQKIVPHQLTIATEGVALILNRNNPDSLLHLSELKNILDGKINDWKDLGSVVSPSGIELIFDHPASGIVRFLKDSVTAFGDLPRWCFAVNSNAEVVNYVSKNVNAIGLIGVSWISDHDDSTTNQFLSSVRVAGIAEESEYYQPYQAYLAQGYYPLIREVTMISREARAGLASGFMAFVAGEKGQRIVLKAGLVPETMPVRIVEINHEPF